MSYQIHHIFPTPLISYKNFLPEEYFDEAKKIIMAEEYENYHNRTGLTKSTTTKNILKKIPWLNEEIIETFKEYIRNIHMVDMSVDFKIGSSWGTLTEPDGFCQWHTHGNYYYSGCMYFSENCSPISFGSASYMYDYHQRFMFKYAEVNKYNSNEMKYLPQKNEILFFPSYVRHAIAKNKTNEDRYSIAFNIHPTGIYGEHDSTIHIEVIDDLD
jgi:uncharacterized protein (TIGR02466 family)